jgi:hypothetical protein
MERGAPNVCPQAYIILMRTKSLTKNTRACHHNTHNEHSHSQLTARNLKLALTSLTDKSHSRVALTDE